MVYGPTAASGIGELVEVALEKAEAGEGCSHCCVGLVNVEISMWGVGGEIAMS
jgi:hypothetical protein